MKNSKEKELVYEFEKKYKYFIENVSNSGSGIARNCINSDMREIIDSIKEYGSVLEILNMIFDHLFSEDSKYSIMEIEMLQKLFVKKDSIEKEKNNQPISDNKIIKNQDYEKGFDDGYRSGVLSAGGL